MNTTNKSYLYEVIDKEGFKHFCIYDHSGNVMRDQSNPELTPEQVKEDIEYFFQNNFGVFRVDLRRAAQLRSGTPVSSYTVSNKIEETPETSSGIGSLVGGGGGLSVDRLLDIIREKDAKIETQNQESMVQLIGSISKQNELNMELLRKDLSSKNSTDDLLKSLAPVLSGLFGGGMGISGLNDTMEVGEVVTGAPVETPEVSDYNAKINRSVYRLMQLDKDLAGKLDQLVELAEKEPNTYQALFLKL